MNSQLPPAEPGLWHKPGAVFMARGGGDLGDIWQLRAKLTDSAFKLNIFREQGIKLSNFYKIVVFYFSF